METRRDLNDRLERAGINGAAAALICKETAATRHAWRVEETKKAALTASNGKKSIAIIMMAMDLSGVGGRANIQGIGTCRLAPFLSLGKGRKQARDGDAWMAAMVVAINELSQEGIPAIIPAPPKVGVGLCLEGDEAESFVPLNKENASWMDAFSGRELMALYQQDKVDDESTLSWVALYNATHGLGHDVPKEE